MVNYTQIIHSIETHGWFKPNNIIRSLIEFEHIITNSNNDILVTSVDEGDGVVMFHCCKLFDDKDWTVTTVHSPYDEELMVETYSEAALYQLGVETILEGGCVEPFNYTTAAHYRAAHLARAIWEYHIIVLSNGYETVTYYDPYDEGFILNENELTYMEAEKSFINTIKDGFTIVFKGYRKEEK